MVLLDTDILIEVLRGSLQAKTWMGALRKDDFGIPGVVAMELLMGCRNQLELRQITTFLESFNLIWPEASEVYNAYGLLANLRLSSGLGIPDYLIAGLALARDVQEPYVRSTSHS
jgi:predicted nucleic acid-binding protein